MDLGIKGKKVLVTGASSGLGRLIATEFAKEGCLVSAIARREKELKELVKEIGGEKKGHSFYTADLMEKNAPAKAVKELSKKGNFEIVVHNLGGTLEVKDPLASADDWHRVWKFNVGISIEINNLVIPSMQKNKWGRIVNISSISAESLRGSAAYAAAKAYLNAYTKTLGRAVAKDGIVVSALMPGAIYTKGGHWDENTGKNAKDKEAFFKKKSDFLRHHHAIGRLGNPEEIAPFVLFMASKHVTFANGSVIPADGGTM
ncbi:SDR family oxidoreductase [Candidatus Woesearchaeota archaeon]|nr:SDR family oxidoreductase [Candidatus Woesearchaeota archaeon]